MRKVFEEGVKTAGLVLHIGESDILRKPAKEVSPREIKTENFKRKLSLLKRRLLQYRKLTGLGRGMAAPQIGIHEKFVLIYTQEKLITIINPKITKVSKTKLKYPEVCMSAYPIVAPVVRPSWIEFEYRSEMGLKRKWEVRDGSKRGKVLNRVVQHEIDHLEGIINIDKVSSKELFLLPDKQFFKRAKFEKV